MRHQSKTSNFGLFVFAIFASGMMAAFLAGESLAFGEGESGTVADQTLDGDLLQELRKEKIPKAFIKSNPGYSEEILDSGAYTIYKLAKDDRALTLKYDQNLNLVEKTYACIDSGGNSLSFTEKLAKKIRKGCPAEPIGQSDAFGKDVLSEIKNIKPVKSFIKIYPGYGEKLIESGDGSYLYQLSYTNHLLEITYVAEQGITDKRFTCIQDGLSKVFESKINKKTMRSCDSPADSLQSAAVPQSAEPPSFAVPSRSISLDKSVYPIPFGDALGRPNFPLHPNVNDDGLLLDAGILTVYVQVKDDGFDLSDVMIDTVPASYVEVEISRNNAAVLLLLEDLRETGPDTGIFEAGIPVRYDAGPHENCPLAFDRDGDGTIENNEGCILKGDVITIAYGDSSDSAEFGLKSGELRLDGPAPLIGSDIVLTMIDPDLDLDGNAIESYTLDLIGWETYVGRTTLGPLGGDATENGKIFDPEPLELWETGESTGVFQVVLKLPRYVDGEPLEPGAPIYLEYVDWGPRGAMYVGDDDHEANLYFAASTRGASIQFDKAIYTWTDRVYITITAPDLNDDSSRIETIGDEDKNPVFIETITQDLGFYRLAETGPDTGVFVGEVTLAGFGYDADGDPGTGDALGHDVVDRDYYSGTYAGPTDGRVPADNYDGIAVTFEFSEYETYAGSAIIRWNLGDILWGNDHGFVGESAKVLVVDPDMNWNPDAIDSFKISVSSDSASDKMPLEVTETGKSTGVFKGAVLISGEDSGDGIYARDGDTVTATYGDHTPPLPYWIQDSVDVSGELLVYDAAPASVQMTNLRIADSAGRAPDTVKSGQQVFVAADLLNERLWDQGFAHVIEVYDDGGDRVHRSWLSGILQGERPMSPMQSWIPAGPGTYTVTAILLESVSDVPLEQSAEIDRSAALALSSITTVVK